MRRVAGPLNDHAVAFPELFPFRSANLDKKRSIWACGGIHPFQYRGFEKELEREMCIGMSLHRKDGITDELALKVTMNMRTSYFYEVYIFAIIASSILMEVNRIRNG